MDAETNKTIEELKAESELKNKWLSLIAHDFKGLFSNTQLLLNLLQEDNISQEMFLNMTSELKELADRNAKTLESTFAWVNAQIDGLNLQIENIVIHDMYDTVVQQLSHLISVKDVSVTFVGSQKLSIDTDKFLLRFILKELIENAIKYSHKGGVVEVKVSESDQAVEVAVSDSGIGMEENVRHTIGTMQEAPRTGTLQEKGAGLSWVIIRDFVKMLDGQLTIKSSPDTGTVVSIVFANR